MIITLRKGMCFSMLVAAVLLAPFKVDAVSEVAPQSVPLDKIFKVPQGANSTVRGNTVIITEGKTSQIGSIFSENVNKLDLREDFESEMYISLDGTADGVAFVMHNDPDKVAMFNGQVGNGMGVYADTYSSSKTGSKYILEKQLLKSFAIEFDTYWNSDNFDKDIDQNLDAKTGKGRGHVAYSFPDDPLSYTWGYLGIAILRPIHLNHNSVQYPKNFSLGDGKWRLLKIRWKAWNALNVGYLTYEYEGLPAVTAAINKSQIKKTVSDPEDVYWGFTGSTGAEYEKAMVAFRSVPGLVNYHHRAPILEIRTSCSL